MKKTITLTALLVFFSYSYAGEKDSKDMYSLASSKNCLACHSMDKKVVGPAFKDVRDKYAKDSSAVAKLTEKVMKGGKGSWGEIPMPANTQVNKEESEKLVKWILSK